MFIVELALLALLICFALVGSKRGFLRSVAQLVGVMAGFLVARSVTPAVVRLVGGLFPTRVGLAEIVVFTLLFLFVERIVGWMLCLVGSVLRFIARWSWLHRVGSFLGGVLGAVEGVLLSGGIIYWIRLQHLDPTLLSWLNRSQVARFLDGFFRSAFGFLL